MLMKVERRTAAGRPGSIAVVAALVLVSSLVGCGRSGPEMASVSGKVMYQGKPVPKGTIAFIPVSASGRTATGAIGPDGSYRLQTEEPADGAQLGEYKVTISAHDEPVLDYTPAVPVKPKLLVPAQYEDPEKSELKKTVVRGSNIFDFDLK
jgi:hypothetical protein